MTTSLRPSLTLTPDPSALPPGPCPIAQRLALGKAARRVLEVRPCGLPPDLAVRLAALANYRRPEPKPAAALPLT